MFEDVEGCCAVVGGGVDVCRKEESCCCRGILNSRGCLVVKHVAV